MKKSLIISIISLQVLILAAVGTNTYLTHMNKARIRATQRVMVETQEKLASTFAFMDKIAEAQKAQAPAGHTAQAPVEEGLAAGSEAPAFSLQNEEGKEVSLADLHGKKTLLVFSQESCPYCQNFYPVLNDFGAAREDVNVVVMQLGSTPEQNKAYKQQQGIDATVLAAGADELVAYKVTKTPTSVLLDEEGKVLGTRAVTQLAELNAFVQEHCEGCEALAYAP